MKPLRSCHEFGDTDNERNVNCVAKAKHNFITSQTSQTKVKRTAAVDKRRQSVIIKAKATSRLIT